MSLQDYSFQIVIPYLNFPWALHDLIESMGELVCPVLVVDNSPDSNTLNLHNGNQLDREDYAKYIEYVHYPQNYGVPGSWNLGVAKGADYTLILSTAVRFTTKSIAQVLEKIPEQAKDTQAIYEGYHMVAFSKEIFKKIGLFDENFYPGYGEDADWGRRLDLANIRPESFYDAGNTTIGSGLNKRSGTWIWDDTSPLRTGRMDAYLYHKWGGPPYQYEHPFGNPDNPLSYWPSVHH
jgi:hypothetical protein